MFISPLDGVLVPFSWIFKLSLLSFLEIKLFKLLILSVPTSSSINFFLVLSSMTVFCLFFSSLLFSSVTISITLSSSKPISFKNPLSALSMSLSVRVSFNFVVSLSRSFLLGSCRHVPFIFSVYFLLRNTSLLGLDIFRACSLDTLLDVIDCFEHVPLAIKSLLVLDISFVFQ